MDLGIDHFNLILSGKMIYELRVYDSQSRNLYFGRYNYF